LHFSNKCLYRVFEEFIYLKKKRASFKNILDLRSLSIFDFLFLFTKNIYAYFAAPFLKMDIYMKRANNGRIDIKSPNTSDLFFMYDKIQTNQCATFRNPTDGLWDQTDLSRTFFSLQNIQILRNGIRAGVYRRSNGQYTVGVQDCDALKIVMRSVFLQYAANKPTHISEQIAELNKIVLNYCIQQVYGEAQGYMKYIDDVSTLVVPIAHPVMANNTDRQLELKSWF